MLSDADGRRVPSDIPSQPPPELRFKRNLNPWLVVRELVSHWELLLTVTERQFRVRYKQAILGVAWSVLNPLALMLVFVLFFQRVAKVDTHGTPYALFSYMGLIPWTFFSSAVSMGGLSLVSNKALLNKVYCPREIYPAASVGVASVDALCALITLVPIFIFNGVLPRATSIWVPLLLVVQLAFTVGLVLTMSSVLVYLRDVQQIIPVVLQLGLFATPVAYGMEFIPRHLQPIYSVINPLAPVIDGYRRCVLYGQSPRLGLLGLGALAALVWLVAGYTLFKRLEMGLADVA